MVKLTHVQSQSVTGMEKAVYMELVKLHSFVLVKLAGRFTEIKPQKNKDGGRFNNIENIFLCW